MNLLRLITFRQQAAAGFDPDAQAFITAAGITDPTQQSAINTLVLDLKGYGIWTKMKAVYPFVGGTATTHKYNLKDPRDLDAAFRLSFINTWTHSSTGAIPTGGTAYADTFLLNGNHLGQDSAHASYYVRNHVSGQYTELGIDNSNTGGKLNIAYNWNGTSYPACQANQNAIGGASAIPSYWIISRTGSANYGWFRNTTKTTVTQASSAPNTTTTIKLGGYGLNYSGGGRECAFATIGDGLSDAEVSNLYTAVQAYQTTLGRQV